MVQLKWTPVDSVFLVICFVYEPNRPTQVVTLWWGWLKFLVVMTSSEPTEELVSPGTLISTTAPEQTSLIQEIEFVHPVAVTISSVDLEEMDVTTTTSTNSSNSEKVSESTRSTGTAIAATGFVVVFIVFFLMVAVGITLNVCRYNFLNYRNFRIQCIVTLLVSIIGRCWQTAILIILLVFPFRYSLFLKVCDLSGTHWIIVSSSSLAYCTSFPHQICHWKRVALKKCDTMFLQVATFVDSYFLVLLGKRKTKEIRNQIHFKKFLQFHLLIISTRFRP